MKPSKPIRLILDHPKWKPSKRFYEVPARYGRHDTYEIVTVSDSGETTCTCNDFVVRHKLCVHCRRVELEILFSQERGEKIETIAFDQMPHRTKKAASRFSNVEV